MSAGLPFRQAGLPQRFQEALALREELERRLAITFSRIPETDAKAEGAALGRVIAVELLR